MWFGRAAAGPAEPDQQGQLGLEALLHALVGGDEAQRLVEAVRLGAALVGGELHDPAVPLPGTAQGVRHEAPSDAAPATVRRDPDRLDGHPPAAAAAQA